MARRIVVFGANGATGRELVRQAAAAGHHVRASDRRAPEGVPSGVEAVAADVLEGDLRAVLRGMDAVVSCLGVPNDPKTLLDPPPLYSRGAERITEAMKAEGVDRIAVISASFVTHKDVGPLLFRTAVIPALSKVLAQMEEMEATLRASGLRWTAVRPGWLMEGEATGDPWVGEGIYPDTMIRCRHGDLAALLLDCAANDAWVGKTPYIARDEPTLKESSAQVVLEMLA
jgi:nucleoside-diphosphate-sugar epimerase